MTKEAGLFMAAQTYCHNVTSLYIYTKKKKAECTKEKHTAKHRVTKKKKETRTKKNREQHQAKKRKREEHTKTWKKFQQ